MNNAVAKVPVDYALRRKQLLESRLGHMPFHEQLVILPGLSVTFASSGYNIPKDFISGYVGVHFGQIQHRIPFQYITHWSAEEIDMLRHSQLARSIMRKLYPKLMAAKEQQKLNYFKIRGLAFNYNVGVGESYFTY